MLTLDDRTRPVVDMRYRSAMVTLDTIRAPHEHDHKLAAGLDSAGWRKELTMARLGSPFGGFALLKARPEEPQLLEE